MARVAGADSGNVRLAVARLCSDGQSSSPLFRNSPGQFVGRDVALQRQLYELFQSTAPVSGASVPGSIQGAIGGRGRVLPRVEPVQSLKPGTRENGGPAGTLSLDGRRPHRLASWPAKRFLRPCSCHTACPPPLWLLSHRNGSGIGI